MSEHMKEARRVFQPRVKVECTFGRRIRPFNVPLGTPLGEYYWTNIVTIIRVLYANQDGKLIYLVDDQERQVIGIGVIDTHRQCKSLWVDSGDFVRYTDDDERHKALIGWQDR